MNESLRVHLAQEKYHLPKNIVDEVCDMFKSEANNLLDSLSALKPEVRDVALHALRDYYTAMDQNNTTFQQVATVLVQPQILPNNQTTTINGKKGTANDDTYEIAA